MVTIPTLREFRMEPKIEPWVQKILENADCRYNGYSLDVCVRHNADWPPDEWVCNAIIRLVGKTPRRYYGDGRADGNPVFLKYR